MNIEEAKKQINYLKRKLRFTRSTKMKALVCTDIMSLESFIKRSGEVDFSADLDDFAYLLYKEKILKDKRYRAFDIVNGNCKEMEVAEKYVSLFDKNDFIPHLFQQFPKIDEDIYAMMFRDFVGTLGPRVTKIYNKLIENNDIVIQNLKTYGGVCWDFPTIDRQVVSYNVADSQYVYFLMAHELGHATQMAYMNQTGRRRLESMAFCESISSLMEILFQKYLEKVKFNCFDLCHFNTSVKLDFAAGLHLATMLAMDNEACFDGLRLYFPAVELEKYCDRIPQKYLYLYEQLADNDLPYEDSVFYTIGDACARKIYETTENSKTAIDKMLDFLNRAELHSVEENIEYLGLDSFEYKSLEDDIIKYRLKPRK